MTRASDSRWSLRRALALSTALHLLVLPALIAILSFHVLSDAANFTRSATMASERVTIERHLVARAARHRTAPALQRIAVLAPQPVRVMTVRAPRRIVVPEQPAAIRLAANAQHSQTAVPVHEARPRTAHALAVPESVALAAARSRSASSVQSATSGHEPAANVAGVAIALATATPAPALPTPSVAPTATAAALAAAPITARDASAKSLAAAPVGGWGQSFEKPLLADDDALGDLRKRYHTSGAVAIDVDDSGHAVRITLPSGTPAGEREALERELLALRYVPAECNGLRCAGTMSITL